jgi:predicted dehydrogenase
LPSIQLRHYCTALPGIHLAFYIVKPVFGVGLDMSKPAAEPAPRLVNFPLETTKPLCDPIENLVRIGVVGCGYWGPKLVRNFGKASGAQVVAVADLNPVQLQRIGQDYPSLLVTTDYRALIDDVEIEAIAVATPVATHFAITRDVLRAGKHAFVEKPLATSVRESEELIELADRNNCLLMVDHTYLFTGAVEKMRELVANGELGKVLYFDSTRINLGLFQHDVNVVWDLAPHDLSILLYVLNKKPVAVSALAAAHAGTLMENLAYITLTFDDDTLAHFHVNWLAPRKIRQIIIGGERKMLVFDDMESNEKIKVYDKGISVEQGDRQAVYQTLVHYRVGDMWAPRLDPTEALLKECRHFTHCIRENKQPINDGLLALEVVRLLEAASESIRRRGELVRVV